MSKVEYLQKMADTLNKLPRSDFYFEVELAQAALESDFGKSELATEANNHFGHKYSDYTGDHYIKDATETVDGELVVDKDTWWRKYKTVYDGVLDHSTWLTRAPKYEKIYAKAIKAKNWREQARELMGTYATDTPMSYSIGYEKKLINIIETYELWNYNKRDKKEGVQKMAYIGLDIGHGANTWESGGGKGVYTGGKAHEEHTFNSIVARKLKPLLEATGHKVTYGVQQPMANDTSLAARTGRFNAEKVDIMVSIHANWVGNFGNSTNGIAAFYDEYRDNAPWGATATRRSQSKKLAQLIMAEYRKQGQAIYTGGMGDGKGSIPSYVGAWTDFHMNRVTTMPSVLMELGFMSGNKDFDKIFGSQQDKYTTQMAQGMADGINAYFGVAAKAVDVNNPQGLKAVPMKPYKAPEQPFTKLNKGEKVTLAVNFQWANLSKAELLRSNRYDELVGKQDIIEDVKDISNMPNRNHSDKAYKIMNSWILEEYLIEAKRDWKDGIIDVPKEDVEDAVQDDEYEVYEFERGFVKIKKTDK